MESKSLRTALEQPLITHAHDLGQSLCLCQLKDDIRADSGWFTKGVSDV